MMNKTKNTKQASLFDVDSWQRWPFGDWIHHQGNNDAERRIAQWLLSGGLLWLHSTAPIAGKSHLLHEVSASCPTLKVLVTRQHHHAKEQATARVARWLKVLRDYQHWAIDLPADAVDAVTGEALFHLLEHARSDGQSLLIAWSCADSALSPPELASRLRMIEQIPIAPPSNDHALAQVLQSVANNMHWVLPQPVLSTMLLHTERTLAHQLQVLHQLEIESRDDGVRTTQRWVRDQLKTAEGE